MKKELCFFLLWIHIVLIAGMQQLPAQPPVINSFSPANGYAGSLVTINGSKLNNPTSVTIGGVNAIIISFNDIQLTAMIMPNAVAGAVSVTTANGTATGSSSFIVSISTPPNKQLGDKLVGESTANSSQQGSSVATSADGKQLS